MFSSKKIINKRSYFVGFSDDSSDDEPPVKKQKKSSFVAGFQFLQRLINNLLNLLKMTGNKTIDYRQNITEDNNETVVNDGDEENMEENQTRTGAFLSQKKNFAVNQGSSKFETRSQVNTIPIPNSKSNPNMCRIFNRYPSSAKHNKGKDLRFMPYPNINRNNLYSLKDNSSELEILNDSLNNSDDDEITIVYESKPINFPFTHSDYENYSLLVATINDYKRKWSRPSNDKHFTVNEVVRLKEKANYETLLQKFNSISPYFPLEKKSFKTENKGNPFYLLKSLPREFDKTAMYKDSSSKSSSDNKEDDETSLIKTMFPVLKQRRHGFDVLESNWIEKLKSNLSNDLKEMHNEIEAHKRVLNDIHKKSQENLRLINGILEESVTAEEEKFPEITKEMENEIDKILESKTNSQDLLCKFNGQCEIRRKDIETLYGLNWLNDEIINAYLALIVARSQLNKNYPKVFAFNTFFYHSLKSKGYKGVKRWTRKIDIFSYDIIFVPFHLGLHWALGVIDHKQKKILYYDSLENKCEECLDYLSEYIFEEANDKKPENIDPNAYTKVVVKDLPLQMNGNDCGMFTLKYAEYISRGAKITFTQQHMAYFRKRMIYELLTSKLLPVGKS